MLLKVFLGEEFPQTGHAVYALGLALVPAVQLRQAKVAVASQAGVRQQTQVAEAVLQQRRLLSKGRTAICAFEEVAALLPPVTRQRPHGGKIALTRFTFKTRSVHVQLDVVFTCFQRGKDVFALVTLVKLLLKMRALQVRVQVSLRGETQPTDAAHETIYEAPIGLGVRAQVDSVVVNLAEAFSAFGTAVRTRASVQVHVVLELELGGQLEITHAAGVLAHMTRVCWERKEKKTQHAM